MNDKTAYRHIVRATTMVGGATVVSLVFSVATMKVLAIFVGPTGVGLFGILYILLTTGAAVAGLNLQSGGVALIGATAAATPRRRQAETALLSLSLIMAVLGGFALWAFEHFFYMKQARIDHLDPGFPWIPLALAISVINAAQGAILQAYGKVREIALAKIGSSCLASVVGIASTYLWGFDGLFIAIFAMPASICAVTTIYYRAIDRLGWVRPGRWILQDWKILLGTGGALTAAALIGSIGQILVRSIISEKGGLADVGLFQAAWTISNTNLGIVLAAMAVDYFPRLAAQAPDRAAMTTTFNHQLRTCILLAGPLLIVGVGMAKLLLTLLFSPSFAAAGLVLQLQLTGDVWKLLSWALGFVILANRSLAGIVLIELVFELVMVGFTWGLYSTLGVEAAALGYVAALIASTGLSLIVAKRGGISLDRYNMIISARLFVIACALTAISSFNIWIAAVLALVVAAILLRTALADTGVGSMIAERFRRRRAQASGTPL